MRSRRKTLLVLNAMAILGLICWLSRASFTQSPKQDRIVVPIDRTPAVWLKGNVRPVFRPENDLGPVEDSFRLENISLMFKLTGEQQSDLTALLAEQQDASSPNYHHWLTPEQYADRFGLTSKDLNRVVAWLQSQGFQITQTARSRNWVSFSGTAAQVQTTFLTEIDQFSVNGQTYYGNATEPAVPAALADVVLGIHALDNYPLQPHGVVHRVKAEPDFTSGITGSHFIAPGDFAVVYDVKNLYSAGINGSGQTIAVMGQTDLYNNGSDITAFRAAAGLPANPPSIRLVPGATDPGVVAADIDEASLDVEWAGAAAPNANILFVNGGSNNVFNAFADAINNNLAPVITVSYGGCEALWEPNDLPVLVNFAQQANLQGQTIISAAGDAGAADCDNSTPTSVITSATHGLAVDAPASLPYVTGMGGSEFNEGSATYWQSATNGDVLTSALSYIPEMAWNDTLSSLNPSHGLLAGGGGVSSYFLTKPTWQTGPGVPDDNARDVPDVSLSASPGHDGFLICVQGNCVNGFRDVSQNPALNNTVTEVGGTSVAAPNFAGIVALVIQHTSQRWGNINPILYPMAQNVPAAFHDITTGNNVVPCTSGSTGCPPSGQIGYNAGVGYDQATGLGSVDAYNLVMNWNSTGSGNLAAPLLTAPASGATGVSLPPTFTWSSVIGNAGYQLLVATSQGVLPTETSTAACSACTISTSTATVTTSYTPAASSLAASTTYYWEVQALTPSGSTQTATWSNASSFTTGAADFSLSATPSSLTINPGANGTSTLTLSPVNNFSATPTFACTVSSTLVGVTCAVGTFSNNTATVTITASSTTTSYPPPSRNPRFGAWWAAGGLLALLLIVLSRMHQVTTIRGTHHIFPHTGRLQFWLVVTVLVILLGASLSCGGGSGGGGGGGGTGPQPESGTVTVTGTSNSSHSTQITVSVS